MGFVNRYVIWYHYDSWLLFWNVERVFGGVVCVYIWDYDDGLAWIGLVLFLVWVLPPVGLFLGVLCHVCVWRALLEAVC